MANRYTRGVATNPDYTLEDYALDCFKPSRIREEPSTESLESQDPVAFYSEALSELKITRDSLEDADPEERLTMAKDLMREEVARKFGQFLELSQEYDRYSAMLDKVRRWTPAEEEYQMFKQFMEKQLVSSIEYGLQDFDPEQNVSHLTVEEYLATNYVEPGDEEAQAYLKLHDRWVRSGIIYYENALAKASREFEEDSRWLKGLLESLAG